MSVSIAFVLLLPQAKLSLNALIADFAAKWPELGKPEPMKSEKGSGGFRVGDDTVIVAHMPAPFPWSDLEGPCATSWLWPKAEEELRPHNAHLIVTVLSGKGPVEQSRLLTQAVASVLAVCPQAPGVYWGNATLVIPSKIFQDFTAEILPQGPPLYLWLDVRVGPTENGRSAGFTTGMKALGHMELETENSSDSPGDLMERFFSMAEYLLENGPVIKHGDTVGADDNEKIRVVYSASAFGHQEQVMRLEWSSNRGQLPWVRR